VFTGFSDINQGKRGTAVQEVVQGRRGDVLCHIVYLHKDGYWRIFAPHLSMIPHRQRTPAQAKQRMDKQRARGLDARVRGHDVVLVLD
jgi:hypothetical protein